jgi:hypothetical protein
MGEIMTEISLAFIGIGFIYAMQIIVIVGVNLIKRKGIK